MFAHTKNQQQKTKNKTKTKQNKQKNKQTTQILSVNVILKNSHII
jgi:hypothetical protein